jgi:hypothetical protein
MHEKLMKLLKERDDLRGQLASSETAASARLGALDSATEMAAKFKARAEDAERQVMTIAATLGEEARDKCDAIAEKYEEQVTLHKAQHLRSEE